MELSGAIAQMAMSMSTANLQQSVNTAIMKKAMDANTDMIQGIMDMADSIPKFNGEVGSMLDVRA